MYLDNIRDLGWPEPLAYQHQSSFIRQLLLAGIELNTRQARFAGIGNLHSKISELKRKGVPVSVRYKQAIDPFTHALNPYPVLHVLMTEKQRAAYLESLGA
ncbi:hypothetical protein K6U27_10880 [Vibrio fluvialis]|uniref:hypothetical protein n=1 Tax=Vibrio fluvialis TaxID=676 RepID=UPI001EEA5809|nr:hypothetical protein [Vibrio fluvialis]MCG6373176.1 hypothetical protein [Vibrio fluvialis]